MAKNPRTLSKSRFKTGWECPSKLFFTGKPEYGNTKLDNAFLKALAEGGFQVGELARLYHPGGQEIEPLATAEAVQQTQSLLEKDKVILYEPAIQSGDLLVRVDVLVKSGSYVELIEVKAKSFDPSEENCFYDKRSLKKEVKKLNSTWEPYLLDIAFQTYVAKKAHPDWKISSFLMLADKTATATVDGINQKFFLTKDERGHSYAETVTGTRAEDLGAKLLVKVPVDDEVSLILEHGIEGVPFEKFVKMLADAYVKDEMLPPVIGGQCKSCEFRIGEKEKASGLKSGFDVCWAKAANLTPEKLKLPMVFEIWNFRKSAVLIEEGKYFISDLTEEDISPTPHQEKIGLSASERQWLQVKKILENDESSHFDAEGFSEEMSKWKYPLHFIDFETTMAAIPFNKGRRPYEQIAFQFSHHVVTQDGKIEHKTEYINRERGFFPNFEFLRQLKMALSGDEGTIFRFAAHENTVLNQICNQLKNSEEPDREELIRWARTITKSTGDSTEEWEGARNMVDMCELVKKYFYHPKTHGSNSIKKVLPAILQTSEYLQNRWSGPVYGSESLFLSKNYKNWSWIQKDKNGSVIDPYKLLPPVFTDLDLETMDSLIIDGSIADGGAAMTAYARMQFTQMSEEERDRVTQALLKYCELDTFAMVLIYEYWKDLLEKNKNAYRAA